MEKNKHLLSEDFNKKLFKNIERTMLYKNILSLTIVAFLKTIVSLLNVFSPVAKGTKTRVG